MARIVIDPVTRIEGHFRIECDVESGKVMNAWSSGQMWRGMELLLRGRDPRSAWILAQRICGTCTTSHAIASVRAVENALNLEVPINAQLVRNLIMGAHATYDHIIHFYHLCLLDWVDLVSALKADPTAAAILGQSLSDWHRNSEEEITVTKSRLRTFVQSGQLGIYRNGYWGHPAFKLPPEMNLLAITHYLQALEYQQIISNVVVLLGGKTPHIQNMAVGGVTNVIDRYQPGALNMEKLNRIETLIDAVSDFINQAFLSDVAMISAFYSDWTGCGAGVTNYLSAPDMPLDTRGISFEMPGGYIPGGDMDKFTAITSFNDAFVRENVTESIKHSWYDGNWTRHPYQGKTVPAYTIWQDDGRYSWIKAPTFLGKPAQVGPLAHVLCLYAAGHLPTHARVNEVLDRIGDMGGTFGIAGLQSTMGRIIARWVRCAVLNDTMKSQCTALIANIAGGDLTSFNEPTFPKGELQGLGFHEAPRGILSHWLTINNGKIENYQIIAPSTWNACPRNGNDEHGPIEASLLNNPVADPERPLEVLRTVHSFDPCLACAAQ